MSIIFISVENLVILQPAVDVRACHVSAFLRDALYNGHTIALCMYIQVAKYRGLFKAAIKRRLVVTGTAAVIS